MCVIGTLTDVRSRGFQSVSPIATGLARATGAIIYSGRGIPRMSTDDPTYQGAAHTTFTPDDNRTLSEAVLKAIEEHQNIDLVDADFTLYEIINPDALERLFRFNQNAATTVSFVIDDTHVSLRDVGDGIEIGVADI